MIIFYFLFVIGYLLLAIWRPKWALFLICTLLPTYQLRFQIFGLPTTLLEVLILALFIIWFFKFQIYRLSNIQNLVAGIQSWLWPILAWLIVGLIAVFVSLDKWLGLGHWRAYFLEPVMLLVVFLGLRKNDTNLQMHPNDKKNISSTMTEKSAETADLWPSQNKTIKSGLALNKTGDSDDFLKKDNPNTQNNHFTICLNKRNSYSISNLILIALGISAFYCSIWAICQKWLGGGVMSLETWRYPLTNVWRATGPFPQPNFLGLYLAPIVILMIGQIFSYFFNLKSSPKSYDRIILTRNIRVWFFSFSTFLSIVAIILARSEGAILGILAGLIFLGLLYSKSRKWVLTGLIILIIFVLFFSAICVNPRSNLRQSALCANEASAYILKKITLQDLSGQIRLKIWSETITMLKERPIFGAGLRGYQAVIEKYHEPYLSTEIPIPLEIHPYPHNLFLAIWSELGTLGLIVFLWILIKFFYQGFNKIIRTSPRRKAFGFLRGKPNTPNNFFHFSFLIFNLSAMVVLLVHGAFDTPYFKNDLSILFWLIIGLVIINRSSKNEIWS